MFYIFWGKEKNSFIIVDIFYFSFLAKFTIQLTLMRIMAHINAVKVLQLATLVTPQTALEIESS